MTREELDGEWAKIDAQVGNQRAHLHLERLLAAERALNQREAEVRALRWAAKQARGAMHYAAGGILDGLAEKLERGEIKVSR